MGSIPQVSVLRGEGRSLPGRGRPLHRALEIAAAAATASGEECGGPALLPSGLSLAEVDAAASRLARVLVRRAAPTGPNSDGDWLVAVAMAPSVDLVVALLAVWKAGAAYLPLDKSFPAQRLRHILAEARPALFIADHEQDAEGAVSFESLQEAAVCESSSPLTDSEMLQPEETIELAFVLYTSGSTGVPKGVRVGQTAVLNRLRWQWRCFPYAASERVCVFKTALTFVDSVSELWGPLLQGRSVLVVPRAVTRDPQRLVALLNAHQVERLVLVPSLLRALLMYMESSGASLPALRLWVCSGEPLPVELARSFFRFFPAGRHVLCNFYGSTEVMGDVTVHVLQGLEDLDLHPTVPIGLPIDNTCIYLLNEEGHPAPVGEVGQLFVAGFNLASGYVRGRDADRFVENSLAVDPDYSILYRTGDYARFVKGTVLYEGRTDSQIKIRGHRVDITEVERIVTTLPGVDKAVVLCYKPGDMDQALLAFITLKDINVSTNEIESMLQKNLTSYMVPQVMIIDSIPLLVNGKTDRQALLKRYEEISTINTGKNKLEYDFSGVSDKNMDAATVLFETVASVLGRAVRSKISLQSNFYELGGNSLNSIFTVTQLKKQGYFIGISEFISAKNMSEILKHMVQGKEYEMDRDIISKVPTENKYVSEMLNESHRKDVYRIITNSFYEKADLEQWLLPEIYHEDYTNLLDQLWEPLVEKNFSFVVKSKDEVIGVGFNFDAYDEPAVEVNSKLSIVFEFLEYLEGPIRDKKLPQGKGHIFHSFMMGTHEALTYQENVSVMQFMEAEVLRIAKEKGFTGIFTTNTSPLTQQLGADVYDYQVLLNFQVNTYEAPDGTKPFGAAPDTQRATCCWKVIS